MPQKTVTFTKDTKDPPTAERCLCCGHRNIKPQIRTLELCMGCFKTVCIGCLDSMGLCTDCEDLLMNSNDSPDFSEDYPEF